MHLDQSTDHSLVCITLLPCRLDRSESYHRAPPRNLLSHNLPHLPARLSTQPTSQKSPSPRLRLIRLGKELQCIRKPMRQWRRRRSQKHSCCPAKLKNLYHKTRKSLSTKSIIVSEPNSWNIYAASHCHHQCYKPEAVPKIDGTWLTSRAVKYFLISAPVDWTPEQYIRRFLLPTGEYVSCVLW